MAGPTKLKLIKSVGCTESSASVDNRRLAPPNSEIWPEFLRRIDAKVKTIGHLEIFEEVENPGIKENISNI